MSFSKNLMLCIPPPFFIFCIGFRPQTYFKPYNVELQHSLQMFHFDMSALHFYLLIGNKALHGWPRMSAPQPEIIFILKFTLAFY